MNDEQMLNLRKDADKILLNSIRIAALNSNNGLVFEYCKKIQVAKNLILAEKLLENMKLHALAGQVKQLIEQKEQKERELGIKSVQKPLE